MEKDILDHLLTVFINSENTNFNNLMISENIKCNRHIDAIRNIEKRLNHYGLYVSNLQSDIITDPIFDYVSAGNIVIMNLSVERLISLVVYLPEQLTEEQKKIVENINDTIYQYDVIWLQLRDNVYKTTYPTFASRKDNKVKIKNLT